MPFALIAVTILLVSTVAVAVTSAYDDSSKETDDISDEIDATAAAIADVAAYVNRGIGDIIRSSSEDPKGGNLEERCSVIMERTRDWMEFQFPMNSKGAKVSYVSHHMEIAAEPMGIDLGTDIDGYTPAYLRGVGEIEAVIETQNGKSETSIEIRSDGNYAIPLSLERAGIFESMTGSAGASLAQMVEYQLTSLAEYRVLNGFGGLSSYGERGTDSILTERDVEEALQICMEALSAICFRDGNLASKDRADLADMLGAESGTIQIDMASVYSQALYAAVDEVAIRWLDYFYGFEVLTALDKVLNPFRDAFKSLSGFLKGEERVSGVPYLKKAMESFGIPESEYRHPGCGTTSISVGGFSIRVENPAADLFEQSWMKDFKKRFDRNEDYVRDFVIGILKDAAVRASERTDLGTVSIQIDPYDEKGFLNELMTLYREAVSGCQDVLESEITSTLRDSRVYDEFYGSLADEIGSHEEEFVLSGDLRNRIREALSAAIEQKKAELEKEGKEYDAPDIDALMSSAEVASALESYRIQVHEDIEAFRALKGIDGGDRSIIHRALSAICSYGLGALGVLLPMEEKAESMASEILENEGMNPYCGLVDMPGSEEFLLKDDAGGTVKEYLRISIDTESLAIAVSKPSGIHDVGFGADSGASYTTEFPISVKGTLRYSVQGSNPFSQAMGAVTSAMDGSIALDLDMDIAVASGWSLEGISYEPSCTILTDIEAALITLFEPLIEPLREIMGAIRGIMTLINEAMMSIAGFVSDHLLDIYRFLQDPLTELSRMIEDFLESAISDAAFRILFDINLGDQSFKLQFFGCELQISTSAATWGARTKTIMEAVLTVPVAGLVLSAGFEAKMRGEVSAENLILTGSGGISGDGWSIDAKIDPLMKGGKYLFTLNGKAGKNRISIAAPKVESYHEFGLTLSDVPGIGKVLDSIPLPMIGANLSLDAGFQIRCKAATQTGLLINEYESNPPGTDKGNEWVEILNNTDSAIDLTGYRLVLESKKRSGETELSGTLAPGEFLLVHPDFTLVNSPGQGSKNGDNLVIRDAQGEIADSVRMKSDTSDDDESWQRGFDGSSEWVKAKSTMGRTNGSWITSSFSAEELKECAWRAVEKSFGRIGSITDLDSFVAFMQYMVRYTLEELIDLVAELIIDASVFISADVKDATSSMSSGIRVAFRTDGDLVKDCLRFIAGKVESLILGIKNPYRINPLEMFTENIDLEVLAHAAVGFPEIISKGADLPKMDLAAVFRANLSSISRIAGIDTGHPGMEFGIMARDCPIVAIPSKFRPDPDLSHDLWLFKATVTLD